MSLFNQKDIICGVATYDLNFLNIQLKFIKLMIV